MKIGKNVKSIAKNAFFECYILTGDLIIPDSVISIGNSAFGGCTNLTIAPKLPATNLASQCYYKMFSNCTSLTEASVLPATILAYQCYYRMFESCIQLKTITMLATNITASECLYNWVEGVASTGTFTKAKEMESLPSSYNGIPYGWSVKNYSEE